MEKKLKIMAFKLVLALFILLGLLLSVVSVVVFWGNREFGHVYLMGNFFMGLFFLWVGLGGVRVLAPFPDFDEKGVLFKFFFEVIMFPGPMFCHTKKLVLK